jgi:hypothetical protein
VGLVPPRTNNHKGDERGAQDEQIPSHQDLVYAGSTGCTAGVEHVDRVCRHDLVWMRANETVKQPDIGVEQTPVQGVCSFLARDRQSPKRPDAPVRSAYLQDHCDGDIIDPVTRSRSASCYPMCHVPASHSENNRRATVFATTRGTNHYSRHLTTDCMTSSMR